MIFLLTLLLFIFFFFFFQAEDGIRDHCVTGVQTCALPISTRMLTTSLACRLISAGEPAPSMTTTSLSARRLSSASAICGQTRALRPRQEIGRASCRERV